VKNYLAKGGKVEDTVGRKCLCKSLMANIGLNQIRKSGYVEPALVTVGDDLNTVAQFLAPGRKSYTAADVVKSLLSLTGKTAGAEPVLAADPVLASA
jgi:nitronate monooxygenase